MLKAIRNHPGVCCPYLLAKYMCVSEFFLNHYFLCQCPSIAYLHSAYFFQYKIFLVYIQPHHFMANRWGNSGNSGWLYFSGLQNHCRWWLQPWNLKILTPWKESYDQPRQHTKKQRHYFVNKGLSSQGYGLPSSHVWMCELDHEESWALKSWFFWTVEWEKTLENRLDCKEIQLVYTKGDLSWVFIWRTDVEAETPILWLPDAKSWLIWRDPDAGKDWGREEKGTTEDGMVGWHHQLSGLGFGWTPGVGDGQGGLTCCGSWGLKESDTTEYLNWTDSCFTMLC